MIHKPPSKLLTKFSGTKTCHDRLGIYGGGGSSDTEGVGSFRLGINGDIEGSEEGRGELAIVWGSGVGVVSEVGVGEGDGDRRCWD